MKTSFNFSLFIILGLFLGVLIYFKSIFLLGISLLGIAVISLLKLDNTHHKSYLLKFIFFSLFVRLYFCLMAWIAYCVSFAAEYDSRIGHLRSIFRDFQREVLNGIALGEYFSGKYGLVSFKEIAPILSIDEKIAFLHAGAQIQGFLNSFFQTSPFNFFIFPFLGIWIIPLTYFVAKEMFHERVALYACFFSAFFPSMIVWSCINIRTTIAIIAILMLLWSLLKYIKTYHIKYIAVCFLSIGLFSLVKEKFFILLSSITLILIFLKLPFSSKIKQLGLTAALILFLFSFPWLKPSFDGMVKRIMDIHLSFSLYNGNSYKIYPDEIYADYRQVKTVSYSSYDLLMKALPKATFYFLLSPFPWEISNNSRLFFYPFSMLWYFILIFTVFGIINGLRQKPQETQLVILFLFLFIIIISLTMGNAGTAMRHRDLIAPFFYIFASSGICSLFNRNVKESY